MNDELQSVPVDEKDFVGVGKMTFESNAEWNIPHLHFMVDKTASGNYESTLLEFCLVSWSENLNDSIKSLVRQTYSHILSVMERAGFEQFVKEADNHVRDGYWRHYRKIGFSLARNGMDLSHYIDSQFVRALKIMISEETKNLILKIARDNVEKFGDEYEKIPSLLSFNYRKIKAAA